MSKKKVLYLIPHLQNQGPVAQLYSLVKNINQEKWSIFILTIFPERDNSMVNQFRALGAEVICGNLKKWQIVSQKRLVSETVKRIEPDLVHSCSTITDGLCSSINLGRPLIITLHNYIYEDVIVQYGKLIGSYLCRQEKKAILKADCVIPCSNTLKNQYEKLIPRKYVAIPNGIETEKWINDTGLDKKGLRKKLGLPIEKYIIISTGALIERKNPLTVIEVFKEAALKEAVLLILGDGVLMEQCKEAANDSVVFTGRVSNVKEYLYASDLLISASSAEGLPYAILEAECTGIPMVLSDIPQHREALGENAENVQFFMIGDKEKLLSFIRSERINGPIAYDIESITAKSMAEKYMHQYLNLIGEHINESTNS